MQEKYTLKKELLSKKGYDYLEDSTCFYKGENIFGHVYIENFTPELLQAVGLLQETHESAIVPNLILGHIVQATHEGKSHQEIAIDILNQTLGKESIFSENIIDSALNQLNIKAD